MSRIIRTRPGIRSNYRGGEQFIHQMSKYLVRLRVMRRGSRSSVDHMGASPLGLVYALQYVGKRYGYQDIVWM
ncbi:11300_t:CDS:2, partial [Acaulospora colombiana]